MANAMSKVLIIKLLKKKFKWNRKHILDLFYLIRVLIILGSISNQTFHTKLRKISFVDFVTF